MHLTFETLEAIWRLLNYDDKREFERALGVDRKMFRFKKKGVLSKYPFTFTPREKPQVVDNEMGGYLIFTVDIPNGHIELLQTSLHGSSLWSFQRDAFPRMVWRRDF
jgi:hypothetical protein